MDLLNYVEKENIECLLISLDFKKCSDTIEFQAIKGSLDFFNFGPYFTKMILTLYNQFESCVSHNGNVSEYFTPTRAIHQGCAVSGYIFVLIAEILSMSLKNNHKIKGIPIPIGETHQEELVSQYINDMHLTTLFEEETLEQIVHELENFYHNTGLRVNYQKSTVHHIGALKGTGKKIKTKTKFKWADVDIKGLWGNARRRFIPGILCWIDSKNVNNY